MYLSYPWIEENDYLQKEMVIDQFQACILDLRLGFDELFH